MKKVNREIKKKEVTEILLLLLALWGFTSSCFLLTCEKSERKAEALITLSWSTETGRQIHEYNTCTNTLKKLCHTLVNTEKGSLFHLKAGQKNGAIRGMADR